MKTGMAGRTALKLACAALLLGAAACDPNKEAREIEAHNAKVLKAEADNKMKRQAGFAVECLSAMRWKQAFLAGAGVGGTDVYVKHYRAQLEKVLGDTVVAAADGAPELSKANIEPYLAWAFDNDVKTKFTVGRDFDGDGTATGKEKAAPGNARVTACIQQAAEAGVGPFQGKDKTHRMFQMQALRARLDKAS
ncbi:hypothetical protein OF829_16990 [Sphingomonas sp. LB-2]|uniref:hypothetical protein n=1 Tax=Sphingomonas caeni TaxID=2984949 RepID=UPI00222EE10E|nr:hypothetical protein [Sphingomonas caeni]MCW3848936.1 hypothetical protein [Sphingomonas caeni]